MYKKSQAALEFLMTYGWAILVVLVAIGALAYFGVLSPDKFLPAKCTLQAGIACLDHKATNSGAVATHGVTVRLQNSLGFDLSSVSVRAGDCGDYPNTPSSTGKATLANGEAYTYFIPCSVALQGLTKYNKQLNVSYIVTETTISHNNVGQITTRVE
ncbi:hypothetical protein HYX02_01355 [Candidatus Woesearchaeota archaeon]|nr:hypothetical protein [Candidatus Woesearchaeota archaeon]